MKSRFASWTLFVALAAGTSACRDETTHEAAARAVNELSPAQREAMKETVARERQQTTEGAPDKVLDWAALLAEFRADKLGTVARYQGKILQVRGPLGYVSKSDFGGVNVIMRDATSSDGLHLGFADDMEAPLVEARKAGTTITARCEFGGDDVLATLRRCSLAPSP